MNRNVVKLVLIITQLSLLCLSACTSPENRVEQGKEVHAVQMHTVVIEQMQFKPAELIVQAGDAVQWINKDIVDHTVTEEGNTTWTSGTLAPGKSWHTIAQKNADYYCTLHPVMKGKLVVQ